MKESYQWVWDCIDSCKNSFQLECCNTLIYLFRQKYTTEDGFGELYDALMNKHDSKNVQIGVAV